MLAGKNAENYCTCRYGDKCLQRTVLRTAVTVSIKSLQSHTQLRMVLDVKNSLPKFRIAY